MVGQFDVGMLIRNIDPYPGEPAWLIEAVESGRYRARRVPVPGTSGGGYHQMMQIESTDSFYSPVELAAPSQSLQ